MVIRRHEIIVSEPILTEYRLVADCSIRHFTEEGIQKGLFALDRCWYRIPVGGHLSTRRTDAIRGFGYHGHSLNLHQRMGEDRISD